MGVEIEGRDVFEMVERLLLRCDMAAERLGFYILMYSGVSSAWVF